MSIDSIVSNFRKLSSEDKIRVVQDLWDQIAQEIARMPLTESQRRLLDERLIDEEKNPDDVEPWAKAKDDILRDEARTPAQGPRKS
jgi:putative addiction module component (TIGR02574 family)